MLGVATPSGFAQAIGQPDADVSCAATAPPPRFRESQFFEAHCVFFATACLPKKQKQIKLSAVRFF